MTEPAGRADSPRTASRTESSPPVVHTADGPPPPGAGALETLLHPLSPGQFRTDYWQQRSLHLTGWSDRFSGLFDRSSLRRALAHQQDAGLSVRVSSDHEGDSGAAAAHVLVGATEVADHLRDGASVCVDPIDRVDPAVAKLAATLKEELGHVGPVSVKCYFSTPGFGFNTHFDAHVVTTVQLEGSKRWRLSSVPGVPFPLDSAFLDSDGVVRYVGRTPASLRPWETPPVDRDGFIEVLLRPGDVLCLPAGTWHEAKATDESSLALNFSFAPVDLLGRLLALVRPALADAEVWRAGIPAGAGVRDHLGARVGDLIRALQDLDDADLDDLGLDDLGLDDLGLDDLGLDDAGPTVASGTQPAAAVHAAAAAAGAALTGRRAQCVLGVSDARRAAAWYGKVLGSEVVSTIPAFGWIEVSTGVPGMTLGLTELPTTVTNGGAVLDFEVDDLERIRATLAAHGVTVTESATEVAGLARFLTAHDPDGNRLMFFEPYDDQRSAQG